MSNPTPKYGLEARLYKSENANPDSPWRPGELVVMPITGDYDVAAVARDLAHIESIFRK